MHLFSLMLYRQMRPNKKISQKIKFLIWFRKLQNIAKPFVTEWEEPKAATPAAAREFFFQNSYLYT